MTAVTEPSTRTGRPRDGRIDRRITTTALSVLAETGFAGFSVAEVALRAGVAKTTIYRRYPTRDDLIAATLERLNDDLPTETGHGSARDQLVDAMDTIRRRTPDSVRGRILMHAVGEGSREPGLAELVHERVLAPRRAHLRGIIEQGISSGEFRPDIDPDVVIPILVGPMLYLGMWRMCESAQRVSVASVADAIISGMTRATGS